jgi:hypothetical protein
MEGRILVQKCVLLKALRWEGMAVAYLDLR